MPGGGETDGELRQGRRAGDEGGPNPDAAQLGAIGNDLGVSREPRAGDHDDGGAEDQAQHGHRILVNPVPRARSSTTAEPGCAVVALQDLAVPAGTRWHSAPVRIAFARTDLRS